VKGYSLKDVAYFVDTYGMNGYKVAGEGDAPLLSMLKMEVAQAGSTILSQFDRSAVLNLMKYFPTGPFVGLDITNGAFTFLRFDYDKLPTGTPSSGDPLADADANYKATPVLFRVGTADNPWKQYTHVINPNGTITKDTVGSVDIETLTGYYLGSKNYALMNDDIYGKSPIITNKEVFVSLLKTVVEYKVATAAEVQTAFGTYMPDVVSAALGTSPTNPTLPEWQALADPQADTLIKAYIAHFGRPADPEGLTYWVNTFKTSGLTMVDLLANFGNSTEYKSLYGSASTEVRINSIYQYLFNRNAEPDGLKFWGDALNNGTLTINNIAYSILNGAQGQDAAVISAKVSASRAFITALNTQAEVDLYKGETATLNARKWLSTVADNQATNTKAMAVANEVISSLQNSVEPVLSKHGLSLGVAFGGTATDRALVPWAALTDDDASAALKAYIAYFGRPADPNGLTAAVEHFNKGGTMEQLTVNFGASDEYKALSAGVTTEDKVNSIYKYLFNREAEADGRTFWAKAIDNGTLKLGDAAMSILNGAQNSDALVIAGKVAAAAAFVAAIDRQSELDLYSNGTAALNARKWLSHASANEQTNVKLIGFANDAIAALQTGVDPVLVSNGFFIG
jgi:hypothetical protein